MPECLTLLQWVKGQTADLSVIESTTSPAFVAIISLLLIFYRCTKYSNKKMESVNESIASCLYLLIDNAQLDNTSKSKPCVSSQRRTLPYFIESIAGKLLILLFLNSNYSHSSRYIKCNCFFCCCNKAKVWFDARNNEFDIILLNEIPH